MTLHSVGIITHPILKSCIAVNSMVHVNYEITVSPILKHNISTKKLQTNEMKLTAAYQLCDHGLSLVPVTAEKKSQMPDFFFLHVVITIDANEGSILHSDSHYTSYWSIPGLFRMQILLVSTRVDSTSTTIVFQLIVAIQQDKLVEFLR